MNQYEIDYKQGYDKANDEWSERIDKIRAEIDTESAKSFRYPNWERAKALKWALNIINKYKENKEDI